MTICVSANILDPRSIYPVLDPWRTAGAGPYMYGYFFAYDAVQIDVAHTPSLSNCQMTVVLVSSLSEPKEIQGWNLFNNGLAGRIGTTGLGLPSSMTIRKPGSGGQGCGSGADTVLLCRYLGFPRGRTALYSFPPADFWDFWGGCTVTFRWLGDGGGSNRWGNQTPDPVYPLVRLPDRTLMRDGPGFRVVFGGTDFVADDTIFVNGIRYLDAFDPLTAVPFTALPPIPVDGTAVREWNRPEVFVTYGGAKFWIPDPPTLFALGFDWGRVGVIPPGGAAKLLTVPIDGTLIKEQHDQRIFLVESGLLRWVRTPAVMEARCLPWARVRTVPDQSLSTLPRGADLM